MRSNCIGIATAEQPDPTREARSENSPARRVSSIGSRPRALMAVTLLLLTPAAARAAAPTQQTLFPEEETLLTIQTTPKAVCILGHATEKGLHLQFDADDRGVVRIHVAARTGAQPIAVRLDCKGEDGHAKPRLYPRQRAVTVRERWRTALVRTRASSRARPDSGTSPTTVPRAGCRWECSTRTWFGQRG